MAKTAKPAGKKSDAKKAPAKQTAAKNATTAKAARTIKYTDKSDGQPLLAPIFSSLRQILLQQVKGPLAVANDKPGQVHVYSKKTVIVMGKKRDSMYFASAIVQKGYVGFYFMPVYSHVFLKKEIAPELLKCLKGKACFHIKKWDDALKTHIQQALQAGYACYEKNGWV